MKERLLRILDLTENAAYSHAARMVSIGKECKEGLNEIKAAEDALVADIRATTVKAEENVAADTVAAAPHAKSDAHVAKARVDIQKPHPTPTGKVTL